MNAEIIYRYFPNLNDVQLQQFAALGELYRDWNTKINVISRKDIDQLYEHHVLHSLAIAKIINFRPGTRILDFGTGGGFPGVPLSILFPECFAWLRRCAMPSVLRTAPPLICVARTRRISTTSS